MVPSRLPIFVFGTIILKKRDSMYFHCDRAEWYGVGGPQSGTRGKRKILIVAQFHFSSQDYFRLMSWFDIERKNRRAHQSEGTKLKIRIDSNSQLSTRRVGSNKASLLSRQSIGIANLES